MSRKKAHLPKTAKAFLDTQNDNKRRENSVRNFHAWLREKKIALSDLTSEHLEAYLRQPIRRALKKSSRKRLYSDVKPYLMWLHDQGFVSFIPQGKARKLLPIPQPMMEFIDTLRPVKKAATCHEYVCQLRGFHTWLALKSLSLRSVGRKHMEQWLQYLANRGLSTGTRSHHIFHVRVYLEWLFERKLINADPGELLRPIDIPKKPIYLPRPFPPEADRELKRRFATSDDIHHTALLLMRCTGLRIGELLRLTPHCLEKDHRDNAFLKVPLGKLDNERLVPLDADTRMLLENLQRRCPNDAEFLLEPEQSRARLQSSISKALKKTAMDLDTHGPVVSHRLRHTYATELMNAGMSLVGIMRLLGHHCIQMTMRYAALTQETVTRDYHTALAKIESKYVLSPQSNQEPEPDRMLLDTIAWLRKNHCPNPSSKRTSDAIIKRIHRIRQDISHIIAHSDAP
jgi:site-specific recombinase XerD